VRWLPCTFAGGASAAGGGGVEQRPQVALTKGRPSSASTIWTCDCFMAGRERSRAHVVLGWTNFPLWRAKSFFVHVNLGSMAAVLGRGQSELATPSGLERLGTCNLQPASTWPSSSLNCCSANCSLRPAASG